MSSVINHDNYTVIKKIISNLPIDCYNQFSGFIQINNITITHRLMTQCLVSPLLSTDFLENAPLLLRSQQEKMAPDVSVTEFIFR